MKIEYYSYYPIRKTRYATLPPMNDILAHLPSHIQEELIQPPSDCPTPQILVDVHKKEVIAFLDRTMEVGKKRFGRKHCVEITEEEIGHYDYFFVDLKNLEFHKHIHYEYTSPSCPTDACPWGFAITSSTKVQSRHTRNLQIGKIVSSWEMAPRFVLSQALKDIFCQQEVTGLKYDECPVTASQDRQRYDNENARFWVAEVTNGLAEHAEDVFIHYSCEKHRIIIVYSSYNTYLPAHAMPTFDFQLIDRIIVNGQEYRYRRAEFLVSQKALNILREHAAANLRPCGFLLKKPFVPAGFGLKS